MARLIDADGCPCIKCDRLENCIPGLCEAFAEWWLSPVDAVEVVRCKDCKHFVQGEPYDPCECMKWKVKFGVAYTTPDGYCHKAERKDND